jgi:hypothetical protein
LTTQPGGPFLVATRRSHHAGKRHQTAPNAENNQCRDQQQQPRLRLMTPFLPTPQMPAPVVADALSYHPVTTAKIATQIGATWGRYAPGDHTRIGDS